MRSVFLFAATAVATVALAAAGSAAARRPCAASSCTVAGPWYWSQSTATSELAAAGLDFAGHHYVVTTASCHGTGKPHTGPSGQGFQQFRCALALAEPSGKFYGRLAVTFYVQGQNTWAWGT